MLRKMRELTAVKDAAHEFNTNIIAVLFMYYLSLLIKRLSGKGKETR
jgi:hypothetical protein